MMNFQQTPNSSYSYNSQPPQNMTPNYTSNNIPLTNVPSMENQAGPSYGYSTGTNIQSPQGNMPQQQQQAQLQQQPMQQQHTPQQPMQQQHTPQPLMQQQHAPHQPMQQQQAASQPMQQQNMVPSSGQFHNNQFGYSKSVREPNSQDYYYDEHGAQVDYQNQGQRSSSVPRSESQSYHYNDKNKNKGQVFKDSDQGYIFPRRLYNHSHHPYQNKNGQSKIPSRVSSRSPNPSHYRPTAPKKVKPIDAGQRLYDGSIREQDTVVRGKEIEILNPTREELNRFLLTALNEYLTKLCIFTKMCTDLEIETYHFDTVVRLNLYSKIEEAFSNSHYSPGCNIYTHVDYVFTCFLKMLSHARLSKWRTKDICMNCVSTLPRTYFCPRCFKYIKEKVLDVLP